MAFCWSHRRTVSYRIVSRTPDAVATVFLRCITALELTCAIHNTLMCARLPCPLFATSCFQLSCYGGGARPQQPLSRYCFSSAALSARRRTT
jgi:hypothetical protein